jgi:TRAP-type C4-dicarboxylate transport system substrate-binding protein
MKSSKLKVLLSLVCMALLWTGLAGTINTPQAAAQSKGDVKPLELSLALVVAPTHTRWTGSIAPWVKMAEERTGGKIKIVPYFAETLAKGAETYTAVSQGLADMAEVSTSHAPGQFRLTDFFSLPGLEIADSVVASRLHWHLTQTVPEFGKQYADTKVITAFSHGGGANLLMSREPIRTLEGLKGKKINIYGGPIGVGTAQALGFTPMHMNIPDVYLSVEKGVLDGVISSVSLITSRKFGEIMKHYTSGPTFGGAPFVIVMNHDKWKKLPLDVQKVFDEIGGVPGAELFGKGMVKDEEDGREGGIKKYGCEFYKLPPDELARWVKPLGAVQEQWVNDMEKKGLAAKKVMEEYRRFVKNAK